MDCVPKDLNASTAETGLLEQSTALKYWLNLSKRHWVGKWKRILILKIKKKTDLEGVETVLWMEPDFPRHFIERLCVVRDFIWREKGDVCISMKCVDRCKVSSLTSPYDWIESKLNVAKWP